MENHILLARENIKFFTALNIGHTVITTNSSVRIEAEIGKPLIFTDGFVHPKYLGFIKRVGYCVKKSRAFLDNKEHLSKLSSKDVCYFADNRNVSGKFENCVEVDINGAYWVCAYKLGYISEELYKEAIEIKENGKANIPKKIRLIALGALARKRNIRVYEPDKKQYKYKGMEYDAELGGVFFHIANTVGALMGECSNKLGIYLFMFFWVDAFMCYQSTAGIVENFFIQNGYSVKKKALHYVNIETDNRGRIATCHVVGEDKPKVFYLSTHNGWIYEFEEFIAQFGR